MARLRFFVLGLIGAFYAVLVGQVTTVAWAAPVSQDCGAFPAGASTHAINSTAVIDCSQTVNLLTELFNTPSIQGGGGAADISGWACVVYGSAKAGALGYLARCDKMGDSVFLVPAGS